MPGATEDFSVDAPATGTYALWITGGAGGQAWYGVNVHNAHFAFPTRDADNMGGRLFFTDAWAPHVLYLTRTDPAAPASVTGSTGRTQTFTIALNDGEPQAVDAETLTLDLPTGDDPIKVAISEPAQMPENFYVQGVYLSVQGAVHPYFSIAPGRRLLPAP